MEITNETKKYKSDIHMVYSCQYHVIFCTKYRRSVLVDEIDIRLKELIDSKQIEYEYKVLDIEVMPDHVHMILDVNPKRGIFSIVSRIKGFTSHELRDEFPSLTMKLPTLWTRSKFISSVGAVTLDVVKKYIQEQKTV